MKMQVSRGFSVRRTENRFGNLDKSDWETVEEILRGLDPDESPEKITLDKACERLIEDRKTRKLAKETVGKYELLARELKCFSSAWIFESSDLTIWPDFERAGISLQSRQGKN